MKIARAFVYTAGAILLITAAAKFVSSFGSGKILMQTDPIFRLQFRYVFCFAGGLEMMVALICFLSNKVTMSASLVAWLATTFCAYRFGLWQIGWHRPCPCLGNLTDALHVLPQTADVILRIILGYLLVGSYATGLWLWLQRTRCSASIPA